MFQNAEPFHLKTKDEIHHIAQAGRVLSDFFDQVDAVLKPGLCGRDVENLFVSLMQEKGAICVLKGYEGFPASLCVSVNHVAAHGVPDDIPFKDGDLISIDAAISLNGWHADKAVSFLLPPAPHNLRRLYEAGRQAIKQGIEAAKAGNSLYDIAGAVEASAKAMGCHVVEECLGHGIGMKLHEAPKIPFSTGIYLNQELIPGMVITIEPVLSLNKEMLQKTGHSYQFSQQNAAVQFENTIAIFSDRSIVLC
jgi:methionyl aminopeptidase